MTMLYDELQEKHQALQREVQGEITPELREQLLQRINLLIKSIIDAGEFIANVRQRERLRDLLRFWGTWMYDQTGEYPQSQLRPFKVENRRSGRAMLLISIATLFTVGAIIVVTLRLSSSSILYPPILPTEMTVVSSPNVLPPINCPADFWSGAESAVFRWKPQTNDSQAVLDISQSGNQSSSVLELQVQLDGQDELRNSGEVFIDLRNNSPMRLQAPLNLEGVPITMAIYVPSLAAGTVEQPSGVQIFVKSQINPKDGFKSEYGAWVNLTNNTARWVDLSLIPARTKPPRGDMEEGFDPANIVLVGIKIAAQKGADVNYSGPIWISDVCWPTQ